MIVFVCSSSQWGDAESSLQQAQKVMKLVQDLGDSELLSKQELVASLHSCIGNAYLEIGEAEKALHHHLQDLKTAEDKYVINSASRVDVNGHVNVLLASSFMLDHTLQ